MKTKYTQKGNVLFLILIAVALFAALSYAVTQSSRSGGDAGRETNILNSAQLTQYPNQIRTAMIRMIIEGTPVTSLEFNAPSDFGTLTNPARGVFHPTGGGAVYQRVPGEMMANGNPGTWTFNMEFEVPQIGLSDGATSLAGNDVIAFIAGLNQDVCTRLNIEAEISGIPVIGADLSGTSAGDYGANMTNGYDVSTARGVELDNANDDFTGKPYGCFENGTGAGDGIFVYYHVLYER